MKIAIEAPLLREEWAQGEKRTAGRSRKKRSDDTKGRLPIQFQHVDPRRVVGCHDWRRTPAQNDWNQRIGENDRDEAKRSKARRAGRRQKELAANPRHQSRHAIYAENLAARLDRRDTVEPALDDDEQPGKTEPGQGAGQHPGARIDHQKVEERGCRRNRAESRECPNVADTPDEFSSAERSDHDAGPKARADRANLDRRKSFHGCTKAQECTLQRIAHLHESKTQKEGKQGRNGRPRFHCHRSLLGITPSALPANLRRLERPEHRAQNDDDDQSENRPRDPGDDDIEVAFAMR
jgi:hypothetical protein